MMDEDIEKRRIPCQIYSRIIGYLRPLDDWNKGKKEEFKDRTVYKIGVQSESQEKEPE